MPCFRCGARQTDPGRGASPWKRGVRAGTQVLVCPDCQRGSDWRAALDRCPRCASTMLIRALGDTVCRRCGLTWGGDTWGGDTQGDTWGGDTRADPPRPADPTLADEVAAALTRVLKRGPS